MKTSFYTITPIILDQVAIIVDLPEYGGRSVTNDAETVVHNVLARFPGYRIVYRDTDGQWDELVHNGRDFVKFGLLTPIERNKFAAAIS